MDTIKEPETISLLLEIIDPDIVAELSKHHGEERSQFAMLALKIGIQAVRIAAGDIDAVKVRAEGEKIITSLKAEMDKANDKMKTELKTELGRYLDNEGGVLPTHLTKLTDDGGPLQQLLLAHIGQAADSTLQKVLAVNFGPASPLMKALSPTDAAGLKLQLESMVRVELENQRQKITREFSMDHEDSALRKLLKQLENKQLSLGEGLNAQVNKVVEQLTLDNEGGALARMRKQLQEVLDKIQEENQGFQQEVREKLLVEAVTKQERAKGTLHGLDYEARVGERLKPLVEASHDTLEFTGSTTGTQKSCKVGDYVITLVSDDKAGARRVVVEAKDDKSYSIEEALRECATARDNRSAQSAVFLFGKGKAPLGMPAIHRAGPDILLMWDEDDPATDINFQVALAVAKVIALGSNAATGKAAEKYDALVRAADSLMKQADKMKELSDMGVEIQRNGGALIQKATTAETEIRRQTREVADAADWLKNNHGKE
jgi:hypothetical protein